MAAQSAETSWVALRSGRETLDKADRADENADDCAKKGDIGRRRSWFPQSRDRSTTLVRGIVRDSCG